MTGRARTTDPDTSHAAAANAPTKSLAAKYLAALYTLGPSSTTEIGRHWDLPRDSFSPRTPALIEKGLVFLSGKKLSRNPSGRIIQMNAYALTPFGRATVQAAIDKAKP